MGEYGDYGRPNRGASPSQRRPLPYGANEYRREIVRVQQSRKRTALIIVIVVLLIVAAIAAIALLGIRLPF